MRALCLVVSLWLALLTALVPPTVASEIATPPPDADFNNDGVPGTQQDVDDFLSVFSEGPCSTGNCDDIDINRDGSKFDPEDADIYVRRIRWGYPLVMPWRPLEDENGYLIIPPLHPDDREIRVSSSLGSDTNDGTSAPVRTFVRAEALLRRGHADRLLLRCGDVFDEQLTGTQMEGKRGSWDKGGLSRNRPMVISYYVDQPGQPLPKIIWRNNNPDDNSTTIRLQGDRFPGFLWFHGIEFEAPDNPNATHAAISVYARATDIVIDACRFVGGNSLGNFDGIEPGGLRNVVVSRCYVGFTKPQGGAHAGGAYFVRVEGLDFYKNVLEHVGFDTVRDVNSKFSQGFYLGSNETALELPFVFHYNLIIEPAHAGLQLRAGLSYAVMNTVRFAPIGISGGHAMAAPNNPWRGNISFNQFEGWRAIPAAAQGECIRVSRGPQDGSGWAGVFGNVFIDPRQTIVTEQPLGSIVIAGNRTVFSNN